MKPQLRELIMKYDPELLWFDGEWIPEWTEEQGRDLYNYLRRLKPSLIINNRVGKGRSGMQGMSKFKEAVGDFGTPEQEILEQSEQSDWESCMTINDTWGFKKHDDNWKPVDTLIYNLIDIAAKGGNYLLNVGPTAEGLIPAPSTSRLLEIGKWLSLNGEAIYNSGHLQQYKEGEHIRFTTSKNGKYIYAILTKQANEVQIRTIAPKKGSSIYMLGTEKPLAWRQEKDGVVVQLPKTLPGQYAWVIKIQGSVVGSK
jgi:alpha-L-fucosidase